MVPRHPAAPAVIGLVLVGLLVIPERHARAASSPNPTVAVGALDRDVPFHLMFEGTDIDLQPGTPRAWTLRLQIE